MTKEELIAELLTIEGIAYRLAAMVRDGYIATTGGGPAPPPPTPMDEDVVFEMPEPSNSVFETFAFSDMDRALGEFPVVPSATYQVEFEITPDGTLFGTGKDCLLLLFDVKEHKKGRDEDWQIHVEHVRAGGAHYYRGSRAIGWPYQHKGDTEWWNENSLGIAGPPASRIMLEALYTAPPGAKTVRVLLGDDSEPRGRIVRPDNYLFHSLRVTKVRS